MVAFSQGTSQSSSSSFIPNYQEEGFLLQLAQYEAALGNEQRQWAMGQFAHTSQITDTAVNNFLNASQRALDLADNNYQRYTQIFQPMEDQLVSLAKSYASPERVAAEMGSAEAGQEQAGTAARDNAEAQLRSFGIDPSSGRYADLERSQQAQTAAAAAGAGQQARYNTEATGRQLLGEAVQVGQQYPGQMVNALNAAYAGQAGAVNSSVSNLNAGVNALNSAVPYFQTASQLRYPPLGSASQSTGFNSSFNSGGGGAGGSHGGDINKDFAFQNQPNGFSNDAYLSGGYMPSQSNTPYARSNPYNFGMQNDPFAGTGAYDPNAGYATGNYPDYSSWMTDPNTFQNYDPSGSPWGVTPDQSGWDTASYGSYDPSSYFSNYYDPFGSGWSGNNGTYTDPSSGSSYDSSGWYGSGYNGYDTSGWSGDTGSYDNSGWAGDYSYAQGGAIPDQGGGMVPPTMSPSGGQQTDDVPAVIPQTGQAARLNANEFVIPKDVAMWKGQEFFQNLIKKSREARMGAPAKASFS